MFLGRTHWGGGGIFGGRKEELGRQKQSKSALLGPWNSPVKSLRSHCKEGYLLPCYFLFLMKSIHDLFSSIEFQSIFCWLTLAELLDTSTPEKLFNYREPWGEGCLSTPLQSAVCVENVGGRSVLQGFLRVRRRSGSH